MSFVGKYNSHECKVELKNVHPSDAGNWTCTVEQYGFFTRGDIVSEVLNLEVVDDKNTLNTNEDHLLQISTMPIPLSTAIVITSPDSLIGKTIKLFILIYQ